MHELVRRDPHPALDGLVRGYAGFWERSAGPLRRRELPTSEVVLILDLGRGWRVFDPADPTGPGVPHGSFAAGLDDRAGDVEHPGEARCVQVNLTPIGARALLGVPMHELAGRVVALEELVGAEGPLLVERLEGARNWTQRFALLDRVLARRAERGPAPRPDVVWAWRRLERTDGALSVSELARELSCSRRHLTARFREEIGMPPKRFARLLRFRRAIALLEGAGDPTLAEVAAGCGYFDQAHFNRDFRAFAGLTPTQLLARAR